jgi:NTE family protein
MSSIGLVLSAGGPTARAFHAGVLATLEEASGWDPRRADLIVGTSAGSNLAALLRAGLSVPDEYARITGGELSPEGESLVATARAAARPPTQAAAPSRRRPLSLTLALRGLGVGKAFRPGLTLAGGLPAGRVLNHAIGSTVAAVQPTWPSEPLWVCAVRVRDGARVVFGRDDVPTPDVATAVEASCAVPGWAHPVRAAGADYVDGGVHSTTNADLVAPLAFDAVVIVSSMTAVPSALDRRTRTPTRAWMSRVLAAEVAAIRATGVPVLVVQPTADDLGLRGHPDPDPDTARAIAEQARRSAATKLARPDSARVLEVLRRAAATTAAPAVR